MTSIAAATHRWRALALAALLTVLAACDVDSPPTASTPAAFSTATAVASPVTPSATASPSPTAGPPAVVETVTPPAEVVASLAAVEDVVVRARGQGLDREVERSFVTGAGMRALLDHELAKPEAIEGLRKEELLLRALGLIGPDVDLLEAFRGLLGSQVVGLYSPDERALFVLASATPGPLELTTYAHEFHHALQDQRFDLLAIDEATRHNRDASLAATSLIEGDATYTQTLYVQQELGLAGALALLGSAQSIPPSSAPPVLLEMLQFPYLQGLNFVTTIARRGGVSAIDAAFARLPASSEQVIHPEKYFAAEAPVVVGRPFPSVSGWTSEDENVLGEYLLQRWLREVGLTPQVASGAAAGWGGDRYAVVQGPTSARALLAFIEWDSPADADEFVYALFPAGFTEGVQFRSFGGGRVFGLARVDASTLALAVAGDGAAAEAFGGLLAGTR